MSTRPQKPHYASSSSIDSDSSSPSSSDTDLSIRISMDVQPVASVEVMRCLRCHRHVEATSTDDPASTGMIRPMGMMSVSVSVSENESERGRERERGRLFFDDRFSYKTTTTQRHSNLSQTTFTMGFRQKEYGFLNKSHFSDLHEKEADKWHPATLCYGHALCAKRRNQPDTRLRRSAASAWI
ncbi:hypothetical protein F4813DRAFT_388136 [Daldinia decipiens]|uniref:uncharacterized protein n=1 Tax=Daldinia decipiens TaxID=326647 RepID=UPI0020C27C8C|nr:uncharacterized protein F4813DRAFT_388136 [Daldinia decipiens]KAI1658876.1 hypothetical protein F4813DRAFT_388136 [Daldinia decipiens]